MRVLPTKSPYVLKIFQVVIVTTFYPTIGELLLGLLNQINVSQKSNGFTELIILVN